MDYNCIQTLQVDSLGRSGIPFILAKFLAQVCDFYLFLTGSFYRVYKEIYLFNLFLDLKEKAFKNT